MIRLTLVAVGCLAWFDGPSATPGPRPSYEQVKAATGRDAASQVKLALWCESHGLEAHKLRHLAVAVLSDPANAIARADGPGRVRRQVEEARGRRRGREGRPAPISSPNTPAAASGRP